MPALARLRRSIARGVAKQFRFPGYGGSGWGGTFPGFWGPLGLLPGTRYDYAREAGITWLSGVVMTVLGWVCGTWPEAEMVVARPRRAGPPEILKQHPALSLLARPNTHYDDTVLWGGTLLSLLAGDGNAYWFKQRAPAGNVVGLVYVPHFQMTPLWPVDGSDFISGYRYWHDAGTTDYAGEEIVHLRNPRWPLDPANPRKAIHPLAGELRSICNDNEERNFSASLLRNMGIPGAVFSPRDAGTGFTPDQSDALKKLWRERFTGDRRGEPLASTIPIDVTLLSFSPEQLKTDSLSRLNISRICAAMGIDPMAVGLPSETRTYANYEQARKAAYENTLIPLQKSINSQLTHQLMADVLGARPDDAFARDYGEVGCLQEAVKERYERLARAVGGPWLTANEARRQVGLEPIEGGDTLYPSRGGEAGALGNEPASPTRAAGMDPGSGLRGSGSGPEAGAAGLEPIALKAAIGAKWRDRAREAEVRRHALTAGGGV